MVEVVVVVVVVKGKGRVEATFERKKVEWASRSEVGSP